MSGRGSTGALNGNFRENICSEDDLRTRISCLPASPRIFEHLQNGVITHAQTWEELTLKNPIEPP